MLSKTKLFIFLVMIASLSMLTAAMMAQASSDQGDPVDIHSIHSGDSTVKGDHNNVKTGGIDIKVKSVKSGDAHLDGVQSNVVCPSSNSGPVEIRAINSGNIVCNGEHNNINTGDIKIKDVNNSDVHLGGRKGDVVCNSPDASN